MKTILTAILFFTSICTYAQDDGDTLSIGSTVLYGNYVDKYMVIEPINSDSIIIDLSRYTEVGTSSSIGKRYDVTFDIRNDADVPLLFKDVQYDCACIQIQLPDSPVLPGEFGTIHIKIEVMKSGPLYQKIVLFGYNQEESSLKLVQPVILKK